VELGGKDQKPTNTLFVVNFDVRTVREPEVERYFDRFGPITRVEIKRNYAFVEYRNVEDAVTAQKRTHGAMMEGRTITVEFVENRGGRENRCAVTQCGTCQAVGQQQRSSVGEGRESMIHDHDDTMIHTASVLTAASSCADGRTPLCCCAAQPPFAVSIWWWRTSPQPITTWTLATRSPWPS
jgi:RNA recognition motif-containing protein